MMSKKAFITSMVLLGASQAYAGEEAFQQLDVDNSGTISAEEAAAVEGLQESMGEYDLNGDKQLDPAEFAQFVETMEAKTAS
jgi:Ca2+-binding EF-hand superfamily protein